MRHFSIYSILVLAMTLSPHAQGSRISIDVSTLGPQVGERVPDFKFFDQAGTERTLQSIMGPHGAMLVFVRSADW